MTKPIMIKMLSLGDGQPKICVPLTGGTAEELFQEAEKIKEAGADLAEWRADFYENLSDTDRLVKTMGGIAGILSGIPLLFTIRTEKEGKAWILKELEKAGYECRDCRGNFIFVKPRHAAKETADRLAKEKKVLVHPYGNELLKDYLRVSVGSVNAMKLFLDAFLEIDGQA